MANTFSKTGITTGQSVEAWHVTQSIDAFSGTEAYNISLSGSFNMTGSINGEPGVINSLTASYAMNAEYSKATITIDSGTITGSLSSGDPVQLLPSPTTGYYYDWHAFVRYVYGGVAYSNSGGGQYYIEQGGTELAYGFNLNAVTSSQTWKAFDGSGFGVPIGLIGWETGSINLRLGAASTTGNGSITASIYYRELPF